MTADQFKVNDRVEVTIDSSRHKLMDKNGHLKPESTHRYTFHGTVSDISTLRNFLKVKSDTTGLSSWHMVEWCRRI